MVAAIQYIESVIAAFEQATQANLNTPGREGNVVVITDETSDDVMVTGDLLSFERAQELDIVNRIFDAEGFDEAIHDFARSFCPPNRASKAVGRIKRSVQSGAEVPFESGLAIERELQQQLFESGDAREGLDAYVEKRKAAFTGR